MELDSTSKVFAALSLQSDLRENSANTALNSGITLMKKKKYDQAAKAFKQASIYKPDMVEAYTYLGKAYSALGKKKEAIDAYKLSLKVDKTQDKLYTDIANLYIDQGKTADAMKILTDGIKQNKLNTLAYYTLGQLQAKAGDYKSAETNFRQVTKLEPKDGNGYYALGMALNGEQRYDEAITQLTKAVSLKKDFSAAIYELGRAYNGVGNQDKLQEQIDRLRNIGTPTALGFSSSLKAETAKPKIYFYNSVDSTLQLSLGPMSLLALDPSFITPGSRKEFTVAFNFDTDMDPSSVMQVTNWQISKARGGTAGLYDNGLYSPNEVAVPVVPNRVTYDATTREAKVTFSLQQNSSINGIIDPKHIVFKFLGKDLKGRSMDESGNEYDGFSGYPF